MSIKLKTLGLAAMVTFAMSLVVAPAAQAQTLEAEFESASGTVTATSTTDVFTLGLGYQFSCQHLEWEGTFLSPTRTLALTPRFNTNCTAFGVANTHIIDNGCALDLALTDEHSENRTRAKATAGIACGPGGSITITPTWPIFGLSVCTVHFYPQIFKGEIDVRINTAPVPDDFTIGPNTLGSTGSEGIAYTVTSPSGPGCPSAGEYQNAAYHLSQTTVRAYSNNLHTVQVGAQLVTF